MYCLPSQNSLSLTPWLYCLIQVGYLSQPAVPQLPVDEVAPEQLALELSPPDEVLVVEALPEVEPLVEDFDDSDGLLEE
jgi:hypothetical protein